MKHDLLKYMSERFQRESDKNLNPGPVITLSRQYGCPAKKVAVLLAQKLTEYSIKQGKKSEWRFISKELLSETAKELNTSAENIKYVFDYQQKSAIDDILASHSQKYYKSDKKIRSTIAKVIRNISLDGHVIIVGRGGVAIAKDIPRSLHINLEAPLEWRALRASERDNISVNEARACAIDVDKKRKLFRELFEGKDTDYTWFDLTLNCMSMSVEEIVDTIFRIAEQRNLII